MQAVQVWSIPNIKDKKVKNNRYNYLPPLGSRGVSYSRANNYGKNLKNTKFKRKSHN